MAENTTINAAAYSRRERRATQLRFPRICSTAPINMPVMHQAVKAYLANQRQGNACDQDARLRHRRKPEAVEAEGNRPRSSGLDPRSALGRRWNGLRTDRRAAMRSTCRARFAHSPARAHSTRALARTRSSSIDSFDYRCAEDFSSSSLLARSAWPDKKVLILTDGVKPTST